MSDETKVPSYPDGSGGLPARASSDPAQLLVPHQHGIGNLLPIEFQQDTTHDDDEIDLMAYWRVLVKRRRLVASIAMAALAVALLLTLMATPIYRSSVLLQIEKQGSQIIQVEGIQPGSDPYGWDPDFMETQIELIKSQSLAERVAGELHLTQAGLDQLNDPGWIGRIIGLLRPKAKDQAEHAGRNGTKAKEDGLLKSAAGVIAGGMSVMPVRDSRLVRINFDSPSPQFAARAVNAVADGYIAAGLERRFGASSYAKTYLEDQLKLSKAKLEDSERQLVAFAQKENIVNTGDKGQSLASQNLTQLNSALAAAQDQRIRAEARWRQASTGAMPADMISNSNIHAIQQARGQLQAQYQLKLQTFKPEYPEMQQLKSQLDELDRQIAAEIGRVRTSVKAEYDAAASQESLLKGQISALRDEALNVDGRSIKYNILKREVDTNRELYDSLLQRYKQVGAASDVRSNNISVIDRGKVPEGRFKPNLKLNLMIGLLLGAILGVLLAFVLEFLDDTLKTPADIEQKLKLPVLGIVPKLGAKESVAAAMGNQQSSFSEAYRSVRTALQFATDHGVPKSLLITSSSAGEGKSTSAMALARNLTQLGKHVLLIDGDMRNPSLHKIFGLRAENGLSNLLAGGCVFQDAVQPSGVGQLDVILAGPLPPNPAELLAGSKFVSLLTVATARYDHVIVDGPPVLGLADAPILANAVDGTVMIVDSAKTRIAAAQSALKRLLSARARIVGALLTKYDARAAGYGYGYGSQYDGYYAYGNKPMLGKS